MRCLILGIGGQDGSYLAEHLLGLGREVHGLYRRSSVDNLTRVAHVKDRLTLHKGDLCDPQSVDRVLRAVAPDEVYNLADQDHVDWSFQVPAYNLDVTAGAVGRLLESLRTLGKPARLFQAISATVFGSAPAPQNESTPLAPQSPYACAKACAWLLCRHYRREHGLWVACGILYNHESPRRGPGYLLQRIARAAARHEPVELCHLDDAVDIGFAGDYVRAMQLMLDVEHPDDYVISSGDGVSVRTWASQAYQLAEAHLANYVVERQGLGRPGERPTLVGDAAKACHVLGWRPTVSPRELMALLVKEHQKGGQ